MNSKEKLKKEIDDLNDEQVQQVYSFIKRLKKPITLETYKLGGLLDGVNIRSKAYFNEALKKVADIEPNNRDK